MMGDLIQFRPRGRAAVEIKNVQLIPLDGDAQITTRPQYAMDDDTSPCEVNPDPFIAPEHDEA